MNFHRRYNVSNVEVLHNNGYLPPASVPDVSLPEVIDNRARNVVAATNKTGNYPNALYHLSQRDSLRALTRNGLQGTRYSGNDGLQTPQHHRRPVFPQGKYTPQSTTQPLPALDDISASSFANRISVEEMSCQNAGDELYFRY